MGVDFIIYKKKCKSSATLGPILFKSHVSIFCLLITMAGLGGYVMEAS